MGKNDFRVHTTSSEKKTFFKKKQTLLGLAFLLTVPQMFSAVILPIQWLLGARHGVALNVTSIASQELYFLVMTIAGISVLKMMLSDKTFSKTLVQCTRLEGYLIAVASVIFPLLPGYQASGSTFFFCDSVLLLPGVLLIIMAELLKEAVAMQKELNEVL